MSKSILQDKSFTFAIEIVNLSHFLQNERREFILSKQVLRSGTAIGAIISEAEYAQSHADFISKLSIALKETNETVYWLKLLYETKYIDNDIFEKLISKNKELLAMLVSSIKTSKSKQAER